MTSKRLHELEQVSQGIHNALAEIKYQHADVDLSAIESKVVTLDSLLSEWAKKLDTPDEPVM